MGITPWSLCLAELTLEESNGPPTFLDAMARLGVNGAMVKGWQRVVRMRGEERKKLGCRAVVRTHNPDWPRVKFGL